MDNNKKKSFASSYPFLHDALCIAAGVFVGGLALAAFNTYVMPKLTAAADTKA